MTRRLAAIAAFAIAALVLPSSSGAQELATSSVTTVTTPVAADAVAGPKHPGKKFDSSCFSGEYVTGIDPDYFERIRQLRSDDAKKKRRIAS